ncbi:MAG: elongation factor G [Oscillospiraceae bacterium]|nr:elongation factor G [Oscillospiraceae bacterium]
MSYAPENIRNVALLGHGNSGKTTLVENMLFMNGVIDRQGKVTDGNTVCDYDPEEIKRQVTVSLAVAPVEFGGCKINVLDCPGYFDFAGEVACALRAVEAGIILVTAKDGISVGAERSWKTLKDAGVPTFFCISKIDEEHGDYLTVLRALREKYGNSICPVTAPLSDGSGMIDVLTGVAYKVEGNKRIQCPIPESDQPAAAEMLANLTEAAAGATEELMEKYFATMTLEKDDIIAGVKLGVKDRSVIPVVGSCAATGIGTGAMLQAILDYVPAPVELDDIDPDGATAAFVFKTISDQFGKYSVLKVRSGKITADMPLYNVRTGANDRLGRLYTLCGKKTTEVRECCCGDIVAVGKMDWKTGDTISESARGEAFPPVAVAEPCYSMAIRPKTKGQDDKVAVGLARLGEEDISFTLVNNGETHQMVLSGAGDMQLDVLCAKLKSRFGVEVELVPAKVAYREKIKGKVEAHGRHKKQSGGSGQFGDVWIRFEPQEEQDDLIFAEEVFGGSVPKNFFPSVEKGLRNAVQKGVLAGYPLVGLKATLYDGSYHPVDSNDMAFQTAARLAYQDGIPKAKPTIMEPIGLLRVTIPDANLGDIMSDISSKRRGTVLGMSAEDGMQIVEAEVPLAEMSSYTIDLRSMTQGRGSFSCKFIRYEEAPANVQQKVIADAKAAAGE